MRKLSTIRRLAAAAVLTGTVIITTSVSGGTSTVSSIKVQKNSGSSSFIISKVGAVDVQEFRLEDPPRLVLDLIGAKHDLGQNKFDGDNTYVTRIRTSQFSHEPQITRVVFDLSGEVSYDVSTSQQSISVRFFPKNGVDKAAAPVSLWGKSTASADKTASKPTTSASAKQQPAAKTDAEANAPAPVGFLGASSSTGSKQASPPVKTQTKTSSAMKTEAPTTKPQTTATKSDATAGSSSSPAKKPAASASPATASAPVHDKKSASGSADGKEMKSSVAPMGFGSSTPVASSNSQKHQQPSTTQKSVPSQGWNAPSTQSNPAGGASATSKGTRFATWDSRKSMRRGATSFPSYGASNGLVSNKSITIDVQNADIKTVLRSMSEFSNTNIIAGPEVEGKVTAHLKRVPWRHALDVILKAHGFGWRDEYGVIRVSTLDNLIREELELQAAERKKDDLRPLVTRIIPLSFANAGELKTALNKVLSTRGSMEVEAGNNALIVMDIERTVDKVQAMVEQLDRRTKQVLIVAKLVDIDYQTTRELGVRWDALNLTTGDIDAVADAVIDARSTNAIGTFRIGTVQSWGQLQLIIDAMEKENKANIISNPRIVTADNREATILVGKEIPLIVSDEAGNPITELTKVGIILRVTPHVNSDNTITLDLHPEVSELSSQATVQGGIVISLSEADTRVVVANGHTAVIGGLINEVESSVEQGVPILMDLPLIGGLFRMSSKTKKKRELIIFVTPTIVESDLGNS